MHSGNVQSGKLPSILCPLTTNHSPSPATTSHFAAALIAPPALWRHAPLPPHNLIRSRLDDEYKPRSRSVLNPALDSAIALGLATPGHLDALRIQYGGPILPILAEQSIREMSRTAKPSDVMSDATRILQAASYTGI